MRMQNANGSLDAFYIMHYLCYTESVTVFMIIVGGYPCNEDEISLYDMLNQVFLFFFLKPMFWFLCPILSKLPTFLHFLWYHAASSYWIDDHYMIEKFDFEILLLSNLVDEF
jgi:hypothetical protein